VGERARRRQQDFEKTGSILTLEQLEREIAERDLKDSTRQVSPLQKAVDAIELQTDGLTASEVAAQIISHYNQCLSHW
jgi:pantoate ligase/cytidylate kinase